MLYIGQVKLLAESDWITGVVWFESFDGIMPTLALARSETKTIFGYLHQGLESYGTER